MYCIETTLSGSQISLYTRKNANLKCLKHTAVDRRLDWRKMHDERAAQFLTV
jgi:hypothetical protein